MVPLIYHPAYNITAFGLERLHPFDSRKYRRIRDALIARGLRAQGDFVRPRPVSRQDLLRVHSADYLSSLRRPSVLAGILEVPVVRTLPGWLVNWRILRPMRYATGGTILACRLALEQGLAINLGGGFHHAARTWGGGFCVYADAPVAAKVLHDECKISRVLVIDFDAHQGNGTAAVFHEWPWATILDLYQQDLFPARKEPEDYPIPVPPGLTGADYLDIVRHAVPSVVESIHPSLVVYNAGSDPFIEDPLAGYRLSARDLAERDLIVVSEVRSRGVPLAMVLSGGYSAQSWKIHADAIEDIITRFDSG
jgi:histone deacetylase 11